MAIITAKPLYMKDADFLVVADDYAAELTSVTITPSVSTQTTKGLKKGVSFSESSDETWKVDITFLQNWDSDTSLSVYLFKNSGKKVTVTFRPRSGGRTITATVQLTSGAIGGALDSYATATVSLSVDGPLTLGPVVPAV